MSNARRTAKRIKRRLLDDVADKVEAASNNTARRMKANVVEQDNVWTTNLFRSIGVSRQRYTSRQKIKISADVPYAAMVEFGTGSRRDPKAPRRFQFDSPDFSSGLKAAITNWVMTKPNFYRPRTISTAMKIAHTIADEGTHAHPFFRPAWHSGRQHVINAAERGVKRTVRRA